MACPVCGSTSVIIESTTEKYDYYICTKCGNRYKEDK